MGELNNNLNFTGDPAMQVFFHIGWMRTGSTYLQGLFCQNDKNLHFINKSHFFSYDPLFECGPMHYFDEIVGKRPNPKQPVIDSDENYSLGRFKRKLISGKEPNYNSKSELGQIYHDVPEMIRRIKTITPCARIIGVIRNQVDWISSVYGHDVRHHALDLGFEEFLESTLGRDYLGAADYNRHVDEYEKQFGRDNVKILLYEDLKVSPESFHDELMDFLGIRLDMSQAHALRKNIGMSQRTIRILRVVNKLSQRNPDRAEKALFKFCRRFVMSTVKRLEELLPLSKKPVVSSSMASLLRDRFREENKCLAVRLGKENAMKEYGYF